MEVSKEETDKNVSSSSDQSTSIEIQPLSSVVAPEQKKEVVGDPSVIVNYDVLGK